MRVTSAALVGMLASLSGCAGYQAPSMDHPSPPVAFRNARMPDPAPPAQLPARRRGSELFVVLPGADGKVGAIFIEKAGQRVVLDQAFVGSQVTGDSGPQAVTLSKDEVDRRFGAALGAVPARPMSFVLYFVSARDELTEESQVTLRQVLTEFRSRSVPDIVVTGHTDSTGTMEANDLLSQQRADRIKTLIVNAGIDAARIQTVGRGKRELLVPTADNVAEPRNRRVEISVR